MAEIELPEWVQAALIRPELERARRESWVRARELGGRPDLEWAWAVNVLRGNCVVDPVLSPYYEYVSSWDEVVLALRIAALLEDGGVSPDVGIHVGLGLEVFDNAFDAPQGLLRLPGPGERFRGRHWTWQVREHDDETLIFLNTWGRGWGRDGFGFISRAYFETHVDCAMVQRPAYTGTSPDMDRALYEVSWRRGRPTQHAAEDWVEQWPVPNPRLVGKVVVGGATYERWRRIVFSFSNDVPAAHVFDLVDAQNHLLGRFHLIDSRTNEDAVLQEIWVVPEHRRRGFGRALVDQATALARDLGNRRLVAPILEPDAQDNDFERAAAFLTSCGLGVEPHESRRPNVVAIGTKSF